MRISTKLLVVLGLAVAVGLATAVSPFASSSPDGLEKVATDKAVRRQRRGALDPGGLADPRLRLPRDRQRAGRDRCRRVCRHPGRVRDRLRDRLPAAPALRHAARRRATARA